MFFVGHRPGNRQTGSLREAGRRLPQFFSHLLPFVALTRFLGRLLSLATPTPSPLGARVFLTVFLTVVAATAMLYGLRSTLLQ